MAASTVTLTLALAAGLVATASPPARAGDPTPPTHLVQLELRIAGLTSKGCDVEIKPGHAGCKFRTVTQHVGHDGSASILVKDVVARNADRDCTFAITIHEPGHADRTVHRGLRLPARAEQSPRQQLTCYLSSPSRLARTGSDAATKR
jgi:hypothetical protein